MGHLRPALFALWALLGGSLALAAACQTLPTGASTTADERLALGAETAYEAARLAARYKLPGSSPAQVSSIMAKDRAAYRALCKVRLTYNLANPERGRELGQACKEALGRTVAGNLGEAYDEAMGAAQALTTEAQ